MKNLDIKKISLFLVLTSLLTFTFSTNFLNKNDSEFVNGFGRDSETLVLGKILADRYRINTDNFGLGFFTLGKYEYTTEKVLQSYSLFSLNTYSRDFNFKRYTSQYGLQGHFFSLLTNRLGIDTVNTLRFINILIFSIVLSILIILISKTYGFLLGSVFTIVFVSSPWITAFAGNLYWVPFTWFLPALFSILLFRNSKLFYIYLPLIFLSVFIKSLSGYEFLSTILIFTVFVWIIELIMNQQKQRKTIFIQLIIISIVCLTAFILAIFIHASIRNNDVFLGINTIWTQDVLRRTYSTDSTFLDIVYRDSILATPLQVLQKYFNWDTPIILYVNGKLFVPIIITSTCILIFNSLKKKKNCQRDWLLFIVTLICPLSWFILAKAHSFIHTHINFVLWYFGFIQVIFYIIIKFIIEVSLKIFHKWITPTTTL